MKLGLLQSLSDGIQGKRSRMPGKLLSKLKEDYMIALFSLSLQLTGPRRVNQ